MHRRFPGNRARDHGVGVPTNPRVIRRTRPLADPGGAGSTPPATHAPCLCAPRKIRTSDTWFRRPVLYPAELWAPLPCGAGTIPGRAPLSTADGGAGRPHACAPLPAHSADRPTSRSPTSRSPTGSAMGQWDNRVESFRNCGDSRSTPPPPQIVQRWEVTMTPAPLPSQRTTRTCRVKRPDTARRQSGPPAGARWHGRCSQAARVDVAGCDANDASRTTMTSFLGCSAASSIHRSLA